MPTTVPLAQPDTPAMPAGNTQAVDQGANSAALDDLTSRLQAYGDRVGESLNHFYELGCQHQAELDKLCAEHETELARAYAEFRMPVKNPPGVDGEGFIYVIAFTTGTVKVGQTEDPSRRLGTHQAEAAAFGVGAVAYWISPSHRNFKENEDLLKAMCSKVSRRSRREYYHEVGYDQAVEFADSLDFDSQITNQVVAWMDRR